MSSPSRHLLTARFLVFRLLAGLLLLSASLALLGFALSAASGNATKGDWGGLVFLVLLAAAGLWLWRAATPAKAAPATSSALPAEAPFKTHSTTPSQPLDAGLRFNVTITGPAPQPADSGQVPKDAWDQAALDDYMSGHRKVLRGQRLHLRFRDASGVVTERDVTSEAFTFSPENHSGVLWAFCHLRQANRPFRFGQVLQAIDLDSGEIIPNLGAWLQQFYETTPAYASEAVLTVHGRALCCLYAMGKADGAFRAGEKAIIDAYLARRGVAEPAVRDLVIEDMRKGLAGTKQEFWDAAKGLRDAGESADALNDLLDTLRQILVSGKTIDRAEVLLLAYAAKTWGLPMPELPTGSPKA